MSAPFIVPFNFQPASVSVKTGSYAIPAGFYAKVVVEVDSGGIFTIDSVNALTSAAFVNVDAYDQSNSNVSYTVPSGYYAETQINSDGSISGVTISGNATGSQPSQFTHFSLGPGGSISFGGGLNSRDSVTGYAIPSNATNRTAEFWLPSGTVINGSGNWRATVMEFPEIS